MALIPSEQKFHTLDKDTPTKDRGSKQAQDQRKIYTMADIVETAGGGGVVSKLEYTEGMPTSIGSSSSFGNLTRLPLNLATDVVWELNKSSHFIVDSNLNRVEYYGLNTLSVIEMTYNITIAVDGPGAVQIGNTETGSATGLSYTQTFTEATTVTIDLSGTSTTAVSPYFTQILTYITSVGSGTITINTSKYKITQPA